MKILAIILILITVFPADKIILEKTPVYAGKFDKTDKLKKTDYIKQSDIKILNSKNLFNNSIADSLNYLINPDLKFENGEVPGWHLVKTNDSRAELGVSNGDQGVTIVKNMYYDRFFQKVNLPKGHYLLRALVKANIFQIYTYSTVNSIGNYYQFRIPVPISNEFTWIELPFYVTAPEGHDIPGVEVGFQYSNLAGGTGTAGRYAIDLYIKKAELIRLGDTSLPHAWEKNIPGHLLHGLETLNNCSNWEQPGKVIFKDSFLGTEVWLMTQGGQTDMSYVGFPDFSNDGKYLQAGHRRPGYVIRTDGSYRHHPLAYDQSEKWNNKIVWMFPWEEKRIPEGTDKSDWIVSSRDTGVIKMINLVTGKSHHITMPSRQGWHIIHYPSATTHAIRGPAIGRISYETLVWQSDDRKSIALSNMEGENFRIFNIKSISTRPENDVVHPSGPKDSPIIPLIGGKGGDNWRNALDKNGNIYFVFEINRDNPSDHPYNPYQLWAISLNDKDKRGLLRIVPYPGVNKNYNDTREYTLKWWEFAAGFPQAGDNGIFMLEDNTLIHMSSLGMHSGFLTTINTICPYKNEVTFIANFPKNTWSADRISWPHEFRHDRDFAVLEAITDAAPYGPIVMIDLKHKTAWTLVLTNYHDYFLRYWQRPQYRDRPGYIEYHKPMFRHAPTPSPDFTKVTYCSSMLTGDDPEKLWGDAYIAVARYPQAPDNVKLKNNALEWEPPFYSREIKGYNIYFSGQSGNGNYQKLNIEPVEETRFNLKLNKTGKNGFYTVTSVEYSGLESRNFSNEVSVGNNKIFRLFYQAEEGELSPPMVPFFEPAGAANSYAVAVTDPELIYKQKLSEGLKGSLKIETNIPKSGKWKIWARVRTMTELERSTYTSGWPASGEPVTGSFDVSINGKLAGRINIGGFSWKWVELDCGQLKLSRGENILEFATSIPGIAIDNILLSNDLAFYPVNPDNTPVNKPSVPLNLKAEKIETSISAKPFDWRGYTIKAHYVKIKWEPSGAPQGIRYYSIYRSNINNFSLSPATLVGTTSEAVFIDTGIKNGEEYFYRVIAVDNWDNHSEASDVLQIKNI